MKCSKMPRLRPANQFAMVEKSNHNAIYGYFMSREAGERFIKETVPSYIERGIYMDKTLTVESFEIIQTK